MKKAVIILMLGSLCYGCFPNDGYCHIEYMDGTTENIPCYNAYVEQPLFGAPSALLIESHRESLQTKSLATIKRWKYERWAK